jgi:hypothetical protein
VSEKSFYGRPTRKPDIMPAKRGRPRKFRQSEDDEESQSGSAYSEGEEEVDEFDHLDSGGDLGEQNGEALTRHREVSFPVPLVHGTIDAVRGRGSGRITDFRSFVRNA